MRRMNRIGGGLLIALLLLAGVAPTASAASAEPPLSPASWLGSLGHSIGSWWATLAGDNKDQRSLSAASEVAPSIDPEVLRYLDPDGTQLSPSLDQNENEVAPSIDPNG